MNWRRRRHDAAKALELSRYRQRIVPDGKKYRRPSRKDITDIVEEVEEGLERARHPSSPELSFDDETDGLERVRD